jgi:transposase
MYNSKTKNLTDLASFFLQPANVTHRQYEALRAFFVDGLPSAEAAARFGYSPGSFRVLCHEFRQNPHRPFFLPPGKASPLAPKTDPHREKIITLRKQNLSVYDIARVLEEDGQPLSAAMVSIILKEEGFAKLPRRSEEERPPGARPEAAPVSDVRRLDLAPRRLRTQFGGLFLFLPWLAQLPFDQLLKDAGLPGTPQIPAGPAVRSLLALKLFGNARHSHIMSHVFDEGLGLFAGLNVIPKRSFLTEYSCRIEPACY